MRIYHHDNGNDVEIVSIIVGLVLAVAAIIRFIFK